MLIHSYYVSQVSFCDSLCAHNSVFFCFFFKKETSKISSSVHRQGTREQTVSVQLRTESSPQPWRGQEGQWPDGVAGDSHLYLCVSTRSAGLASLLKRAKCLTCVRPLLPSTHPHILSPPAITPSYPFPTASGSIFILESWKGLLTACSECLLNL